ncbi:MAG: rhamnulokinase [Promethearchaeota archaeon]
MKYVLAVDLGASSGRIIKVSFSGDSFSLKECHRFLNTPVKKGNTLHWNIKRLWQETVNGIILSIKNTTSIGVDSWGVDYGLLNKQNKLIFDPVHYRDSRTRNIPEWVFKRIPQWTIFEKTGIQTLELNTLFQLASQVKAKDSNLLNAQTYLGIPDIFNFWLTGEKKAEFTHATTTQLYNPREKRWSNEIMERIGIPTEIFPEVIEPGTFLGNFKNKTVIAPACHDTGSAIAAIPVTRKNYAYISSGTWSLLGTEVKSPIINKDSYNNNFTNEGGIDNNFRLLKNLSGLWLEQELLREWARKGSKYDHVRLIEIAKKTDPFKCIIDPDNQIFHSPGDMTPRFQRYCRNTDQPPPKTIGEYIRCTYESLALNYRYTLHKLEQLTKKQLEVIHIIGGGSKNSLLNQMTANATNKIVIAGPDEATALGNAFIQLRSLELIKNIAEARKILSESIKMERYEPESKSDWDTAYERFKELLVKSIK